MNQVKALTDEITNVILYDKITGVQKSEYVILSIGFIMYSNFNYHNGIQSFYR